MFIMPLPAAAQKPAASDPVQAEEEPEATKPWFRGQPKPQPSTCERVFEQAASASKLFISDSKMPLMMGMNFSFAVAAAYMNAYVTGIPANYFLGKGYGGYLAAITAAVAAVLSFPISNMKMVYHSLTGGNLEQKDQASIKKSAMVIGPISFGLVSLLPLVVGYQHLGSWSGLVALFALQGIGRGVWESTNKAIFAEYFAYDTVGAFSNLIIQNGGASTICFFVNAYAHVVPKYGDCHCTDPADYDLQKLPAVHGCHSGSCPAYSGMAWTGLVCSIFAIAGFLIASSMHYKKTEQ